VPVSNKTMTVTRTELALSPLDINDEGTYYLLYDGFSSGGGRWQRHMVESPYTDGEYEVGKRLRNSEVGIALAVKGATSTALDTAMAALIHPDTGAFTAQYDYQVSVAIDGLTRTWRCYAAEWEVDWKGGWIDGIVPDLGPYYAPIALAIPRRPVPIAGST
jgi:hypothetical protein